MTEKKTTIVAEYTDTLRDKKRIRITEERAGPYSVEGPKHIATIREDQAEQLIDALERVIR